MKKTGFRIDAFHIVALLSILVITQLYFKIFVFRDFITFTSEEQIESVKEAEFGFLAQYL
ncbi:MAG: hypothetical protein Q8O19_07525 [Rectinemataceae bacterium]|nr:hypothetical protein [Rectinemataceae bacterium]